MNKIRIGLVAVFIALGVFAGVSGLVVDNVGATAANEILNGANSANPDAGTTQVALGARIATIVNVLLYITGAIAVIMIIIGGIMYTVSSGDPAKAKKAKDTILYSVIGLAVAILAYSIVQFVVTGLA